MNSNTETTNRHNEQSISVFELIYSLLFLLSLSTVLDSYLKTFGLIIRAKNDDFDISGLIVFIGLGLVTCIQYAKIYFNIHKIEINSQKEDHFLNYYQDNFSLSEKMIRFLLAVIVLFATKYLSNNPMIIQEYILSWFRSANNENIKHFDILQMGENYFVPLSIAFILLIIWDYIAFKSIQNHNQWDKIKNSVLSFFCIQTPVQSFEEYNYFRSKKFFERGSGLFLFIFAIVYVEMSFKAAFATLVGMAVMAYLIILVQNEGMSVIKYFQDPFDHVEHFFSAATNSKFGRCAKYVTLFMYVIFILSLFFKAPDASAIPLINPDEKITGQTQNNTESSKEFVLATSKNLWSALPLIALKNGYFADHDLKVSPNYQTAGRYNMDALISKSADFASVVEVNLALLAISVPADVKVVGTVVESKDFSIIARRSAGIHQIADLKDKRIAFSPGTGGEYFVRNFYRVNNLPATPSTFFKVQPNALQDTIIERSVDAVATWEPFVSNIRTGLGDDAVVLRDDNAYTGYMNIAVRKSWADQHAKEINSFLYALRDAQDFIQKNPDEAQKILSEIASLPLETVRDIWPLFDFRVTFDLETQINATRTVAELAVTSDPAFFDKKVPDYQSYFDAQYFQNLASTSLNINGDSKIHTGLLPHPGQILSSLYALLFKQGLHVDIGHTIFRMSFGYMLASLVGVISGLLIGYYALGYKLALPVVDFFRSTPVTVLYPVFVLIFGVGSEAKIAMIFTACVFVIILNTAYGVRSASPVRVANTKLLGASQFQVFRYIIIREATPHILVGMRTALSLALIVSILVEMFMGSNFGIGQKVIEAYTSYRIADVYALILVTGGLGYLLNSLFVRFEKNLSYWYWNERNHP